MQTIVIDISGRVQGVFFRQSTREKALSLGVTGTVCNLPGGDVQVKATGTKEQLEALTHWCQTGPPRARVTGLHWHPVATEAFDGFTILR